MDTDLITSFLFFWIDSGENFFTPIESSLCFTASGIPGAMSQRNSDAGWNGGFAMSTPPPDPEDVTYFQHGMLNTSDLSSRHHQSATDFIIGSSLEDSPLSSPLTDEADYFRLPGLRSRSPLAQFCLVSTSMETASSGEEEMPLPEGAKLPQSKFMFE